jgi:hypothetical protein
LSDYRRAAAPVHVTDRLSWSEEIPAHARVKSPENIALIVAGGGEWSDTTI